MFMKSLLFILIIKFNIKFILSEENSDCIPQLVDSCFLGYFDKILKLRNNSNLDFIELCGNTKDRLNCAMDVLNSDCNQLVGKQNFDDWMQSLESVYQYLCNLSPESLNALWQTTEHGKPCWNFQNYLNCVEIKTKNYSYC
ncbi:hypothetical protein O3M35_004606 [Rhynocoris fuscipes]|uniref:Secreted protein n=1 Tax=Rhynocoris fuscipes TaxID=488301 RepID=A0AAW1CGA0_9HEMI